MTAFKVMLLGEIGVGKTSIARQLVFQRFETQYKATLGVEIYSHRVQVQIPPRAHEVELSIWDVDGDLRQDVFKHVYISGADAALILADISRSATRHAALSLSHLFTGRFPGRPWRLVLNKADLSEHSAVEQAAALQSIDIDATITSAKTGQNVHRCFGELAQVCICVNDTQLF